MSFSFLYQPPLALWVFCGNPYSNLAAWEMQENPWGPAPGNLTVTEKREGLALTSMWILAAEFIPAEPK